MNPATHELYASIVVALARLGEPRPSEKSVHEARKALKKARAALRLLRPGLEPAAYRAENALLRDAGRSLAPLRDTTALRDVLDALRERKAGDRRVAVLARLATGLQVEEKRFATEPAAREAALASCLRLLKQSLARAERPDFADIGGKPLAKGMRRIYRKAREALAGARASRTPEALHEWRKQTKYLHAAAGALSDAGVQPLKRLVQWCADIARWLGDDHDLSALRDEIGRSFPQEPGTDTILARLEGRRWKLQRQALGRGAFAFRKKPAKFIADLSVSRL
jgi:CHAD domain-containing protein